MNKGKEEAQELSFFETSGYSMWPFVGPGEKLVIKKTPIEDLSLGDIILYQANKQLVCHRLVRKVKKSDICLLYARGDSSLSPPEPVTEEMLIGKAIISIRGGKRFRIVGRTQQFVNRLIIIVAPLISRGIKIIRFFRDKICKAIFGDREKGRPG